MIRRTDMAFFKDRVDAGKKLAAKLGAYDHRKDVLVLALPRGGVPVAFEVAKAINAPLDVFMVRKLGVPGHEEVAMGAIAPGGIMVRNEDVIRYGNISSEAIEAVVQKENRELERRISEYRGSRPFPEIGKRCIILVDDGLATGATMRAAVKAVKAMAPAQVVVAVPVGAPETCADFKNEVDEVVCVEMPRSFRAIGSWYENFSQSTDQEVREYLAQAAKLLPQP
jgi:putative phosphoribosyl transferase